MTRLCRSCHQQLPLRAFNLNSARSSAVCRSCSGDETRRSYDEVLLDGGLFTRRGSQIAALERQRRPLIAELVNIDAELADLRTQRGPQIAELIVALDRRRRSLIVSLVKLDDEIGSLREGSNPPPRVIVNEPPSVDTTFGEDPDDDYVPDEI